MERNKVEKIGRYELRETIGRGGMGEVSLAYDPVCEREVAIKRIRPDLKKQAAMSARFLREARITAQLTHPGIISIYTIHKEKDELYYVMPHIKGDNLKQILKRSHQNPKSQEASIPALLPIFHTVCQTIAYAHDKGIIHRDIKPENILVGTFGEVIVLDWGLAQMISEPYEDEIEDVEEEVHLTRPGKMIGTVAYMAPERAMGEAASISSDIYSLGVLLYQILTLHFPFKRTSIKEFRKVCQHEKLLEPEEVAPYREVPLRLSRIVRKMLEPDPQRRYCSMEELLNDLRSHFEGRREWFETHRLDIRNKKHWLFQEHVLISQYVAITRTTEGAGWVNVNISKAAFAENLRLKTQIEIEENGEGFGLLLGVPEVEERETPMEGYCLWIGNRENPSAQLFRNTVEVLQIPDLYLEPGQQHELCIEKFNNHIQFFLDGVRRFTYVSYIPLFGTHVGCVARDDYFKLDEMVVSVGSQDLRVSCLSVPDAFLASRDYKRALLEYRRIGQSFPGHTEGREALFRAGITLLEQARSAKNERRAEGYYTQALEEFSKLHSTPGAPLEYLGKALVYQSLRDHLEEIKCLELGLRRYAKHPLVEALVEQITYRMHEASQVDRRSAYQLILIALRLLPEIVEKSDSRRLFMHLVKHWEPLSFIENPIDPSSLGIEKLDQIRFAIPLAFWLAAPYILAEMFQDLVAIDDTVSIGNLLFALFELGSFGLAQRLLAMKAFPSLVPILLCHKESLEKGCIAFRELMHDGFDVATFRALTYLMRQALRLDKEELIYDLALLFEKAPLSHEDKIELDSYRIWALLKEEQWQEAGRIFDTYPIEMLNQESTPLYPLYGCWLYATEGEEISNIYFSGVIDTPFPRTWSLLGHELTNKITNSPSWYSTSFMWERRQLYQQLTLYYTIAANPELEAYYRGLEREQYIYVLE
ncbi:MAG: serine/threonine-protein kinase PknD [Chlamydiales bacterium]